MTYKIGGYLRSDGDLGIAKFNAIGVNASTAPDGYILPDYVPIKNQLSLSSCVSFACCSSLEILKGLEDPNSVQSLSELFVYYNARNYDNNTNKDAGCYIHNAFNSLTKLGVCEETMWPYDVFQVYNEPSVLCYKQGNDNTINTFYQITSQGDDLINDIVMAISSLHPVVFGTQVGNDLESYNGDPSKVFDPPSSSVGGHAMVIVGYRTNASGQKEFYIRNSWGSWGLQGHAWFSSKYITWSETADFFVPTRIDNLLV